MEKETINLVGKIVERYLKNGPAKALNLSRKAIVDHAECHIIHRLHAMLVIKNDPSDLNLALKHSHRAMCLYPRSLEYRYFCQLIFHNSRENATNVIESAIAVSECNYSIGIKDPMEPCWDLYKQVIDEEAGGVESGEAAVEYVKICFVKLMNSCYRRIDSLPFSDEDLSDMFTPSVPEADSYRTFKDKSRTMAALINNEFTSCGFMQRMFSEVCFQYAVRIKDDDEMGDKRKKKNLDLALASAVVASRVFGTSKDYMINMITRTLQCSENLSVVEIKSAKEVLRKIRSFDSNEPYCKFLTIQEDITNPKNFSQYFNKCIDLLLFFIQTMEERMNDDDADDQGKFIATYYRHLFANDLLGFSLQSIFFKRDVQYLLDNIPTKLKKKNDEDTKKKKKKTAETSPELMKLIAEIVDTNSKKGPSEAFKLTEDALKIHESSPPAILLRLHSKYIFENNRNDIGFAMKFAKMAVSSCPDSLEYRFFHASLQYHEASVASPKDKMLYWITLLDCEKALGLERVAEAERFEARVIKLIDKKAGEMKSAAEIAEYLKNSLRSLVNMCYRAIDDLPKSFFDNMTSKSLTAVEKLNLTLMMLNSNFRFCAFVYRVHSEICYLIAVQNPSADNAGREKWFHTAYISAKTAFDTFHGSMEYGINMVTRYLQALKSYTGTNDSYVKEKLSSFLSMEDNQEPYYKYIVTDDTCTDHEQRRVFFKNCVSLLGAYIQTLRLECDDESFALCRTEIYYRFLADYQVQDFAEKAPVFFKNITYLLKNPPRVRHGDFYGNKCKNVWTMGSLKGKEDEHQQQQLPLEEKKFKKKAKKKISRKK